jgi:hypothetical protein
MSNVVKSMRAGALSVAILATTSVAVLPSTAVADDKPPISLRLLDSHVSGLGGLAEKHLI